jgi:hypothetical protein
MRLPAVLLLTALAGLAAAPASVAGRQQSVVDLQSLMTTPVWLFNGSRQVSQGTGFFFANMRGEVVETVFLVTNYHVVTGRPPGSTLPRTGDRIRFALHDNENDLEKFSEYEMPLYDPRGNPIWLASTEFPNADLVLIPLPQRPAPLYVFEERHTRFDMKIRVSGGATLLGYPYGFFDRRHLLPIWKTGHIATEPDVDFEGDPTFLVDVSAFPGMSGSPVLAVATGIYEGEDNIMRTGRVRKLLGIFSSMPVVRRPGARSTAADSEPAPMTDISLQLGYVWKAAIIVDIARRYQPPR